MMSNNYFQFKQFTVQQDKSAMKVCTDACLFGAFLANCKLQTANCLDIGTGTGLLSLMFAQQNPAAIIDAVEIDADAAMQATENVTASPWTDRIHVFNEDILKFASGKKYDYIISNPPFFENDLQSANETKNKAKHHGSLTLIQLIQVADKHLAATGFFAVLLPFHRVDYFTEAAKKLGLHLHKQILVKQTPGHDFFRGILFFKSDEIKMQQTEIIIKDAGNQYSAEFTALLKDYYLYL